MFSLYYKTCFNSPQRLHLSSYTKREIQYNQRKMAFSTARVYMRSMANELRGGSSSFTTSTANQFSPSPGGIKSKLPRGDFFPVFMSLGLVSMMFGFGFYTVYHQLVRAPNVSLRKSRRETIPEVEQPEEVAEEAERFLKQSFFHKIAHIQDLYRQEVMQSPHRGDVLARPVKVESLKDVGVDPKKAF